MADNVIHLFEKKRNGCLGSMNHGPFLYDPDLTYVVCKTCEEKLNPMAVIQALAHSDSYYRRRKKESIEAIERLENRNRTKCEHCHQMTKIEK